MYCAPLELSTYIIKPLMRNRMHKARGGGERRRHAHVQVEPAVIACEQAFAHIKLYIQSKRTNQLHPRRLPHSRSLFTGGIIIRHPTSTRASARGCPRRGVAHTATATVQLPAQCGALGGQPLVGQPRGRTPPDLMTSLTLSDYQLGPRLQSRLRRRAAARPADRRDPQHHYQLGASVPPSRGAETTRACASARVSVFLGGGRFV